jgi:hypothetical protein
MIEMGIHRAEQQGRPIDTSTARMIATCLGEPGSQLQHFGRTGTLHRTQALLEMEWRDVAPQTQLWAGALWDYLDQPRAPRHQPLASEGRAV